MENVKLINFLKRQDLRGSLIPIEEFKHVPFTIERIFFIKDIDNLPRGFHSHKITQQVLLPIAGTLKVDLTDGEKSETFYLDKDNIGLYIPTNIWLSMYDYSSDCIICVICSHEYNEDEYVRNYGDFLSHIESLKHKKIQCFDLSAQTKSIEPQLIQTVQKIIKNNDYVLGSELEMFEKKFAEYTESTFSVGCSNGTSALICALKALQLPVGSEVIIQSNAYIAAPLAVEACGHKIKIVDIDDTLGMDLGVLESAISLDTRVVLVVHMYGSCVDMNKLIELKEKYGFYLIEDCAQAHGSRYDGKHLGTFGEIGCFSFYPSKNLGCAGEGGCIITDIKKYADYVKKYRNYGSVERYKWDIKGCNERMHNIQAAILNVKLEYLEGWNEERRKLAVEYDKHLSTISQIRIPTKNPKLVSNYHLYIIIVPDREELAKHLKIKGIDTAVHYPETFYNSKAFGNQKIYYKADQIKNSILSLPMYPELGIDNVYKITSIIKEYYLEFDSYS